MNATPGDADDFLIDVKRRWPTVRSEATDEPVFVLASCWRSGSTLLQRMLVRNCLIWGEPFGQTGLMRGLTSPLRGLRSDWPPDWVFAGAHLNSDALADRFIANLYPDPQRLLEAHVAYFRALFAPPTDQPFRRWGFKEVRLGVEYAFYLRWLFPRARFLFLVRNPYDCFRSYRALKAHWYRTWPHDPIDTPEKLGTHWVRLTEGFLRRHRELRGLLIRYEDLTADAFEARAVSDYLGFDLDVAPLKKVVGAAPRNTAEIEGFERMHSVVAGLAREMGYEPPQGLGSTTYSPTHASDDEPSEELDSLRRRAAEAEDSLRQVRADLATTAAHRDALQSERDALSRDWITLIQDRDSLRQERLQLLDLAAAREAELKSMTSSRAWRAATLLRSAHRWVRGVAGPRRR